MDRMLDGSFHQLEEASGVVPFSISEEEFNKTWITVDGIYPQWTRFVKGIKQPVGRKEQRYTKWQEAVRKDIERAFGVLKGTWQFLERPIHLLDLNLISKRVTTCIILHNILVSDRVMGEVGATYNPAHQLQEQEEEATVNQPQDLELVQQTHTLPSLRDIAASATGTGIANAPPAVVRDLTRADRFSELRDVAEYQRLHTALMDRFNTTI